MKKQSHSPSSAKNRITVCGYYGYRNAGDELILQSIINGLKSRIANIDITVLSSKPYQTRDFYNVRAINRWNPVSVFRSIWRSDAVLFAGGLYQDVTGNLSLYYYLMLILTSKICRRTTVLCGVDFGPVARRINRLLLKLTIQGVDRIVVRSKGSYEFIEGLGLHSMVLSGKVHVTADFIMGDGIKVGRTKNFAAGQIKKIGLILRYSRTKYQPDKIVRFCEALQRRMHAQLLFIPFHLEQDVEFAVQLLKESHINATILRWDKPDTLFKLLYDVDLIISQRLHGLIIGTALGIPVLSVSSDTKLAFFMRELNQGHLLFDDFNTDAIIGAMEDIWCWKDEFREHIDKLLPKFRYQANLNYKHLLGAME